MRRHLGDLGDLGGILNKDRTTWVVSGIPSGRLMHRIWGPT